MNHDATPSQAGEAPVWFITGCSTGFGLELARQAIARGYRTVVTARDLARLPGLVASDRVCLLKLDITEQEPVTTAVLATQARFGGIDVLVNNAGIGYFAATEEGDAGQVRLAVRASSGKQPGDPVRAVKASVRAVARGADFPKEAP